MAQPQRITSVDIADAVWARIRSEAEAVVRQEPQLAPFIYASLLEHDTLTSAVVHRISDRLDHPVMTGATILQAFLDALADSRHVLFAAQRRRTHSRTADWRARGFGNGRRQYYRWTGRQFRERPHRWRPDRFR